MELLILEICAAVFLFLPAIRPVFKALWSLDGLVLLPVLSLGILIGIFPVYGFRPECVPLLIFAFFTVISNFGSIVSLFSQLYNDDYRDRGILYTAVNLAVFGFVLWIALYYSPPPDLVLYEKTQTMALRDRNRNEDLWLRIYAPEPDVSPEAPLRPLLLLVPPVAGSVAVTDAVCAGLLEKGFTVLSYSRPGFDSPAVSESGAYKRLSFSGLFRLGNALCRGLTDMAAGETGRELEGGRRNDVEFLLVELAQNKTLQDKLSGIDRNCVFLAGYGAGGAALVGLAPDIAGRFGQVKGIIALESPLYSSLEGDPAPASPPPTENPVIAFFRETGFFFQSLVPRKVTGIGAVPRPEIPVLFVVSDRVVQERTGRYETILKTLYAARGPALVAALPGAGPFDYSDSPRLYPVYSFLFRGGKKDRIRAAAEYPDRTAALMANFAAFIMAADSGFSEENPGGNVPNFPEASAGVWNQAALAPQKTALPDMHIETGGVWNLPDSRFILLP
jgi:hypothetical protein